MITWHPLHHGTGLASMVDHPHAPVHDICWLKIAAKDQRKVAYASSLYLVGKRPRHISGCMMLQHLGKMVQVEST